MKLVRMQRLSAIRDRVSLSLRARVALVSGVVAALVAVTLGIAYFALLGATGSRQFDDTVSTMGVAIANPPELPPRVGVPAFPGSALPAPPLPVPAQSATIEPTPQSAPGQLAPSQSVPAHPLPSQSTPGQLAPEPGLVLPPQSASGLPELPGPRFSRTFIVGNDDVRTTVEGLPGLVVRLEPDRSLVDSAIRRSQLIGLAIGVAGVVLAAVLGWFLAGYAARPLRRLATATHRIDTLEKLPPLSGRGVREAEELSDAITRMLTRLETAHGATNRALASARDFAAVCAHELRTPLTAMRTDLQVLATKELPADQQRAVLADVLLAEGHIENTLTDLEQLAVGELTESDAFEPFDLCETLDRAVQDARRRHPQVRIELTECTPTTLTGLPGGLMLIVTNAVANAVQHGHASTVTIAARRCEPEDGPTGTAPPAGVEILIDDDGTGIRDDLRPNAFDRFIKGPGSPGSGLGLALVRQQAELHSGTAELDHSPSGGVRLRVQVAAPDHG